MTTDAIERKLADRYGRSRPRWGLWIVVGVLAAGLIGYVGWTTVSGAVNSVDYDTTGYELHDAHSVTVRFQVTSRPGTPVACAVEAQDPEHGVVGWRVVEFPGSDSTSRALSVTVPTTAEATTGLASNCWIP
ncbi:DUF4307 domain-containing protein [Microbacterium invictum]|uniref:DUF4307 domain-containing protein n=1 Tax=Microbacterium invictum TaxID=515415 RepID=A0AA40SM70_9MICO|nr:DUF4307 domain-containing protein [Microbacterium invictum]MBB4138699.1 hypothetical protein [Microbacterium invictum]